MTPWLILFTVLGMTGWSLPAAAQDIVQDCQVIATHTPSPDVAYTRGVDVNGKAVVPADIVTPPIPVPETIAIPLSIDLAQRLQNSGVEGLQLEGALGVLEINRNGRVMYEGRDITSAAQAVCGQDALDPLKSGD